MEPAEAEKFNGLYEAIKSNPNVLKEMGEIQFVNTPLHEAASAGQTNFALEMISLAPSFGRKLNPEGLSPLDLAVKNNQYETVKRLVSFDAELVRVKGKEGLTPLHHAAKSDDKIGCLIVLLVACPASIEDLTIRDETALHIAMKNSSAGAFNILYEWVWRRAGGRELLLQKKDAEGYSAEAHHKQQPKNSSQGAQADVPWLLADADDDTKELYDYLRTPEPIHVRLLRVVLKCMFLSLNELTMEMRNAMLVVAVLIITTSFQTILSPPRGLENRNRIHNISFFLLNSTVFTCSVVVIAIVLKMRIYTFLLHLSIIFIMACYEYSLKSFLSPFTVSCYHFGSMIFMLCVYCLKFLLWSVEVYCIYKSVAVTLFLPRSMRKNLRCLHQMGALNLK